MIKTSGINHILAATALLALAGCSSSGDDTAISKSLAGDSSRVNSFTLGDQQTPAVARNAAGNSVIVWDSVGQDGSLSGIYGQRYKNGKPAGGEFRVNTFTNNKQSLPSVAMDAAGNFTVVWRSSLQDSDGGTIYGQRYTVDGVPQGGEFQIGPGDSDNDSQTDPSIAMNADGDFVVVFSNRELSALQAELELINLGEQREVQARQFRRDGTALGPHFTVASETTSVQRSPVAGMAADGSFVVAWLSDGLAPNKFINARRYSSTGTALSDIFAVNEQFSGLDRPAMAMNAAGKFVIAWERAVDNPIFDGIHARAYDASGTALGPSFAVSSRSLGLYERPAVALDDAGNFVIAGQSSQTSSGSGIFFQAYDAAGNAVGGPVLVMDPSAFGMFSRIAADSAGNLSLVWQTFRQDGSGRGVYFRELLK